MSGPDQSRCPRCEQPFRSHNRQESLSPATAGPAEAHELWCRACLDAVLGPPRAHRCVACDVTFTSRRRDRMRWWIKLPGADGKPRKVPCCQACQLTSRYASVWAALGPDRIWWERFDAATEHLDHDEALRGGVAEFIGVPTLTPCVMHGMDTRDLTCPGCRTDRG